MSFFSRPNLEDIQFRQISGSTLTLEGTTKIASVGGLTLSDGLGDFIPVAVDRDLIFNPVLTHGMVLGYDSTVGRIRLMDISGGTGGNIYNGASPASITLGGISEGTQLTGKTVQDILEELLVPAVPATLTPPQITLTTTPTNFAQFYEIGSSLNITSTIGLNRGTIAPVYEQGTGNQLAASGPRVGDIVDYNHGGITAYTGQIATFTHYVRPSTNTLTASVSYASGNTVYNSAGNFQAAAFPAGSLATSRSFQGIFPYYWGRISSSGAPSGQNRPTPAEIEERINYVNHSMSNSWDGNTFKEVSSSMGTITINFNTAPDDYLWFAIHDDNPLKTRWVIQEGINEGIIGGVGNFFPSPAVVSGVESNVWSQVDVYAESFKVYISNYQSALQLPMQIRNS